MHTHTNTFIIQTYMASEREVNLKPDKYQYFILGREKKNGARGLKSLSTDKRIETQAVENDQVKRNVLSTTICQLP